MRCNGDFEGCKFPLWSSSKSHMFQFYSQPPCAKEKIPYCGRSFRIYVYNGICVCNTGSTYTFKGQQIRLVSFSPTRKLSLTMLYELTPTFHPNVLQKKFPCDNESHVRVVRHVKSRLVPYVEWMETLPSIQTVGVKKTILEK